MSLPIDSILPPAPPLRPPLSATCQLHPEETVTGFCPACLRERLVGLESTSSICAPSRKSTSALKSLFPKLPSSNSAFLNSNLRRCKSFSFRRGVDNNGDLFEPQRHSCDVKGRNTLWALFHQDDHVKLHDGTDVNAFSGEVLPRSGSLVFSRTSFAEAHEELEEEDYDDDVDVDVDEIRPVVEPVLIVGTSGEIEETVRDSLPVHEIDNNNTMPMKEHIDLESQPKRPQTKDLKEIAGSFWLAASVFSKKWQKWRRKQKMKKQCNNKNEGAENPSYSKPSFLRLRRRRSRDSEFISGDFGRRSCDTDPRFSLDVGRMSVDDPSFSWDEPRASWDGCLIGGARSVVSRPLPMLSVLEDDPVPAVPRSDGLIPVEEDCISVGNTGTAPGSFVQARDYYRRSFERSNSLKRPSFGLETNETKPMVIDNAPVGGSEFYHFLDREFVGNNSIKDDNNNMSFSFESSFRDPRKAKKAKRWGRAWSILGFIHRRGDKREGNGPNGIQERSFSEINGAKIMRSNSRSSVSSSRSSFSGNGSFGSSRRNGLERNRSARFASSPGRGDNGMLRFYLTPMTNGRRNGKGRNVNSSLFTRSVVGLY